MTKVGLQHIAASIPFVNLDMTLKMSFSTLTAHTTTFKKISHLQDITAVLGRNIKFSNDYGIEMPWNKILCELERVYNKKPTY